MTVVMSCACWCRSRHAAAAGILQLPPGSSEQTRQDHQECGQDRPLLVSSAAGRCNSHCFIGILRLEISL